MRIKNFDTFLSYFKLNQPVKFRLHYEPILTTNMSIGKFICEYNSQHACIERILAASINKLFA